MARVEELLLANAGASTDPVVGDVATHLLRAGGKRIRPALVMTCSRAGVPGRPATDLAAVAIELVHLATLYHDDVMDETAMRRGVPTVHANWGIQVAVLAGDYLFARGSELGAQAGGEVPGILARAIADVCQGQIAETWSANDPGRGVEEFLDTIAKKTAALFRASCELGAATATAPAAAREALVAYGFHLGMAFQIVDDLLDLLGDEDVTGKPAGTDLKEGIYTLPVIYACRRDPSLARRLAEGERELGEVLPLLESTGALAAARADAGRHHRSAREALGRLELSDWRSALEATVDGVLARLP